MIPNTVFGLLALAASLGPGYAYIRIAERRNPRPARSALLELAELLAVGGSCTLVVLLAALPVAEETGRIDLPAFAADARHYTAEHPVPVLTVVIAILVASYGLAILAARISHRGVSASLRQHSVWHELLRDQEAGKAYVTAELRDGRSVAGPVAYYTVQDVPPESREVVLIRPIQAKASPASEFKAVEDDRVVLRGSDIAVISVKYFGATQKRGTVDTQ